MKYADWLRRHKLTRSAEAYQRWFREECAAGRPPDKYRAGPSDAAKRKVVIAELRQLAEQLGRTPTAADIQNHGRARTLTYSYTATTALFGTIVAAQEAAGLTPHKPGRRKSKSGSFILSQQREAAAVEWDPDAPPDPPRPRIEPRSVIAGARRIA